LGGGKTTKRLALAVAILTLIALLLSVLPFQPARANPDWWDDDWVYRLKLTFNNSASGENLDDFPVLIHLTSAHSGFWANINSSITTDDTKDLIFVDADDSTELYFEAENINYSGEDAVIWVNVPRIDAGSTTDFIYLYYGNPTATESTYHSANDVWDANFKTVHHMKDDPDTSHIADSTSNNHNGTKVSADEPNEVIEQIDRSQNFDGNDFIGSMGSVLDNSEEVTFSAWFRVNSYLSGFRTIGGEGTPFAPSSWGAYSLSLYNPVAGIYVIYYYIADGSSQQNTTYTISPAEAYDWHHVVLSVDASRIRLYYDGAIVRNDPLTISGIQLGRNFVIGASDTFSQQINGVIDEVRVSNIARSEDWIEAQYLSMTGSFITYGSPTPRPRTAGASDEAGVAKDVFAVTDDVYAIGSGFPINSNIDVYVVAEDDWTGGGSIPIPQPGDPDFFAKVTITTDGSGSIGVPTPEVIWAAPVTIGEYDIVFDVGQDTNYDAASDFVDHPHAPGFVVIAAPLPPGVGGEVYPIDKAALLLPWLGLGVAMVLAAGGLILIRRRS